MPKKTPMRRCVGCMEMKEKSSLVRVVKNKEGEISLEIRAHYTIDDLNGDLWEVKDAASVESAQPAAAE
jgi:hypothetical protein